MSIDAVVDKWFNIAVSTEPVDVDRVLSLLRDGYENIVKPSHKKFEAVRTAVEAGRVKTLCIDEWRCLIYSKRAFTAVPTVQLCIPKNDKGTDKRVAHRNPRRRGEWVHSLYPVDVKGVWNSQDQLWAFMNEKYGLGPEWARQIFGLGGRRQWGRGASCQNLDLGYQAEIATVVEEEYQSAYKDTSGRRPNRKAPKPRLSAATRGWLIRLGEACPDISYCYALDSILLLGRPTTLKYQVHNGTYELHCEDGPAVEYSNGHQKYFYQGVEVRPSLIESPETITVESIVSTRNAEERRIMRQIYGEGRYLLDSGATILDVDTLNVSNVDVCEERSVPRMLVRDKKRDTFLVGTDGSTGRVYYMPVPRGVKTCADAHAVLAGFNEVRIVSQS